MEVCVATCVATMHAKNLVAPTSDQVMLRIIP